MLKGCVLPTTALRELLSLEATGVTLAGSFNLCVRSMWYHMPQNFLSYTKFVLSEDRIVKI
jgi:hypothetical protein